MDQVGGRSPLGGELDDLRSLHAALKSLTPLVLMNARQRDIVVRTYAWLCAGAALALFVAILDDDELPFLSFRWALLVTVVLAARAAYLLGAHGGSRGTRAP